MAILFEEKAKIFTLQTEHTTWQMQVSPYGHLLHLYYGTKIKDTNMSYLVRGINRGFSGCPYRALENREYSLDTYPQEYSVFGIGDYRLSCLQLEHENGSQAVELIYDSHRIYKGKYNLPGLPALWGKEDEAQTLEIFLKDTASDVKVILYYGVFEPFDSITRACQIQNQGDSTIYLNKVLSACLDIQRGDLEMISFHGRHTMEHIVERSSMRHGKLVVDSVRGTSSHHENPFIILCEKNANEEYGECYGAAFVYSGNFIVEAEVDQLDQTRLSMGIHPDGFRYRLAAGELFTAPEVVFSFSNKGYGTLSYQYHRVYENHLIRSKYKRIRRPVLLNHWEAFDFNFCEEALVSLAACGKDLGIELFVMDDGWFGTRNGDTSGLGDWTVNKKKLPSGIGGFAKKIHDIGMQFGIWIEPEMVNEDSNLYRNHPEWCMKIPGRQPNVERGQMVLDLCRKEVRDYLFDSITKILDEGAIDYVKWDMNRNLCDIWSYSLEADRQGEVLHRYVLGVYELMERFVNRYPDILWEGCSGGGGRFDAGILYYMPQIWCSDNTDAIERLRIQYGTSLGYPISSMGSHVSVSPNHQTGRKTPLNTRAIVAMAGTFGYEMDLRKLTCQEKDEVKLQIQNYKNYYDLIHHGRYYRLSDAEKDRDFTAWQFVSEKKEQSLVCGVILHAQSNPLFMRVRVKGLEKNKKYQIESIQKSREEGEIDYKEEKNVYEGSALMNGGINLPVGCKDYEGFCFVLNAVSDPKLLK